MTTTKQPILEALCEEKSMNGYQITFFTVQDHRHKGKPVGDWLVALAQELGMGGATLIAGGEGFGHHRRLHSVRFFELTDQPQEVVIVTTAAECDRLMQRLADEGLHVFYSKVPVEFGVIGDPRVAAAAIANSPG